MPPHHLLRLAPLISSVYLHFYPPLTNCFLTLSCLLSHLLSSPHSTFTRAFKPFCLSPPSLPPCPSSDLSAVPSQNLTVFEKLFKTVQTRSAFVKLKNVKEAAAFPDSYIMQLLYQENSPELEKILDKSLDLHRFFSCFKKIYDFKNSVCIQNILYLFWLKKTQKNPCMSGFVGVGGSNKWLQ